jgi:hypothetical protein
MNMQREATSAAARLESDDSRERQRGKLLIQKADADERARPGAFFGNGLRARSGKLAGAGMGPFS